MSTCPVPARPGLVRHATHPAGIPGVPAAPGHGWRRGVPVRGHTTRGTGRRARRAAARRSPRLVAASLRRAWAALAVAALVLAAADPALQLGGLGWTLALLAAATAVTGAAGGPGGRGRPA